MINKKSIRISYYALANNPCVKAGYFKYYITSVWGDEITFNNEGWFSLRANGACVLADEVSSLHAVKPTVSDVEYHLVKDIRR